MPLQHNLRSQKTYDEIAHFLLDNQLRRFSFEILPSSAPLDNDSGPFLLVDGQDAAIRKRDLVTVFLIAREMLFSALSRDGNSSVATEAPLVTDNSAVNIHLAAWIALIYDPEHLTAANLLKRDLINAYEHGSNRLEAQLNFSTSVLTSPLHKHSKSPTLWYHRFWLMRTFCPWQLNSVSLTSSSAQPEVSPQSEIREPSLVGPEFWLTELKVVLQAADQHPHNYYAFQYFRRFTLLIEHQAPQTIESAAFARAYSGCLETLTGWCLQHPRDISGLTCLAWLLRSFGQTAESLKSVHRTVDQMKLFQENLQWTGEGMTRFFLAVADLE